MGSPGAAALAGRPSRPGRRVQPRLQVDPARSPLWTERASRLLAAAGNRSLAERSAVRLAVAGIGPDDAGLTAIRTWNRQVSQREPMQREAGQ
jgi:hypothetical protein